MAATETTEQTTPAKRRWPVEPFWAAGLLLAALAIGTLLLPWVWIDDYPAPLNGGELIFFYFASNEKWHLFSTTPVGSLTAIFAPAFIITAVLSNAAMAVSGRPSGWLAVATVAAAADLLLLTGEILDPNRPHLGPLALPEAGLALLLVIQVAVVCLNLWHSRRNAPAGTRWYRIPFLPRQRTTNAGQTPEPQFEW